MHPPPEPDEIAAEVLRQLAPTGVLRAAINLSNFLLVSGRATTGEPIGVAPDMARAVAERLGVPVRYVPYARPSELADAVTTGDWDVGLIGAEPQRAEKIGFTPPYVEIEATYLVASASPLQAIEDVDRPGVRISVTDRTAYALWLERNLRHAELVRTPDLDAAFDQFVGQELEALAGLRSRLIADAKRLPGARVMPGRFATVQQAMGVPIANARALEFLSAFVDEAVASGEVAKLIARHGVEGLSVARHG